MHFEKGNTHFCKCCTFWKSKRFTFQNACLQISSNKIRVPSTTLAKIMNVFTIKNNAKGLGGNFAQQSNHVFSSWSPLWVTLRIAQSSKKEEVQWHTQRQGEDNNNNWRLSLCRLIFKVGTNKLATYGAWRRHGVC